MVSNFACLPLKQSSDLHCTADDTLLALQSTKYLVGIIIAVICSNWVGEAIHSDGIYETDLEADGSVIFLRPSPPQGLYAKSAGQIACKAVWYVTQQLGVRHCCALILL